jgi:hypothetical protein
MHHPADANSHRLEYSTLRGRWPWKPYLLGVATLPGLYFLTYILLRVGGVYYPFFNQGGWDIDGTTNVYLLDLTFVPARMIEADIQNRLRWLPEPTGG